MQKIWMLCLILTMECSIADPAVVGKAIYLSVAKYPYSYSQVFYVQAVTTNGLIAYGGNLGNGFYNCYIDLNDLLVNQASTPVPTGQLTLSKVIGKDGDRVVVSWKLE